MKAELFYWSLGLYLIMGIFYALPAGGPQPADFFMVVILLAALSSGIMKVERPDTPFLLFVGYAFFVSSVWSAILGSMSLYLGAVYFSYNFLVYLVFQKYHMRAEQKGYSLLPFVMVALFIEVIYLVFLDSGSIRAIGTFTNPNQLSYFGLCFTSLGLLIATHEKKIVAGVLILVMGWIISLFGLSKAAMIAVAFQTVIFGILLEKRRGLFFVLGAIAAFIVYRYSEQQITTALVRIDTIGVDHDDSLAGRGYDRIVNDFQHLILGAGEGQYRRHSSVWGGEIHSSLGTILFCYGIPGSILFLAFLASVWRRNRIGFVIYILPLLLYSLTHNGLRYTPFWICLSVCAQLGFRHRKARRRARFAPMVARP